MGPPHFPGDNLKLPRCPFYPASCSKELHGSREGHSWRVTVDAKAVAKAVVAPVEAAPAALPTPEALPTRVTDIRPDRPSGALRQAKWREANREKKRALDRERMKNFRAGKKLEAKP